ncbi:MAG: penicillin-binding protein activator LpoB [bacterium]|nr:penicillin-binding protein activator LpoB [bacterium]
MRATIHFLAAGLLITSIGSGCRGFQYGHLVSPEKKDLVGSHSAGSEVYRPLVEESVAKLLGSCETVPAAATLAPDGTPVPRRVCFVGVENCSAEELGDFREHLYELIDARISQSPSFAPLSRRVVEAALHETRLRPDSLVIPDNMQLFTGVLRQDGQPVDYLLFAKLTSGTTERNASSQRDYLLTLEMVDTHTLQSFKEQAEIRKGYHRSPLGRFSSYNIFPGTK